MLECERYPDGADDPAQRHRPGSVPRPATAGIRLSGNHLAGPPVQDYESDKITRKETVKLTLVCLMLQALLLFRMEAGSGRHRSRWP